MRIVKLGLAASAVSMLLAGCTGGAGIFGRDRPDEFAVTRAAPLVIPPDFTLTPPRPGQASATGTDIRTQAVNALFGAPAARSSSETQILDAAERDRAALGARSVVGDPDTNVVDKGATTQTILSAPEGDGRETRVSTPQ